MLFDLSDVIIGFKIFVKMKGAELNPKGRNLEFLQLILKFKSQIFPVILVQRN